jgi:hypothetical protein
MHGGAPGSGGPKGPRNGSYKHGRYTAEAIASRRWLRQFTRDVSVLKTSEERPGGVPTALAGAETSVVPRTRGQSVRQAHPTRLPGGL